jgi:hypothetical protein
MSKELKAENESLRRRIEALEVAGNRYRNRRLTRKLRQTALVLMRCIPDKRQVMIRYYGLYSNAHRGKEKKRGQGASAIAALANPPAIRASPGWRDLIRRVYETDPLKCPSCGALMKVISFITKHAVIDKIVQHLGIKFACQRPLPAVRQEDLY